MGGFNTQVFVNQAIAAGAGPVGAVDWNDQLHIGVEWYTVGATGGEDYSNGPAALSSWAQDRIVRVWKAQAAEASGLVAWTGKQTKLYNATAGVTIYTAVFPALAVGSVASISGNPLAIYSLPAGDVIKTVRVNLGPNGCLNGAGILFTAEVSTGTIDFNGRANCAVCGVILGGLGTSGSVGPAVVSIFTEIRTIKLWKVGTATDSGGPTDGSATAKLYDISAAVAIYVAIDPVTPQSGTSNVVGIPLATYSLPLGNSIGSSWINASPFTVQEMTFAFAFSAEP